MGGFFLLAEVECLGTGIQHETHNRVLVEQNSRNLCVGYDVKDVPIGLSGFAQEVKVM